MSAVTVYDGNFSFQTTPSIKLRRWPARGGGGWLQRYYVWCELRWWPDLTDMMRCCTEWNKWLIILHIALNANGTFMTHIKQMVPHGMERERELWWQLAPLSFSTLLWGWVLTNGVVVTTETLRHVVSSAMLVLIRSVLICVQGGCYQINIHLVFIF